MSDVDGLPQINLRIGESENARGRIWRFSIAAAVLVSMTACPAFPGRRSVPPVPMEPQEPTRGGDRGDVGQRGRATSTQPQRPLVPYASDRSAVEGDLHRRKRQRRADHGETRRSRTRLFQRPGPGLRTGDRYAWTPGGEGASFTFTAPTSGTVSHQVAIFNLIDGQTLTAQHSVLVAKSHKRILYSDPVIVRFPPYPFKGGTYDVAVNHGGMMPVGCSVISVAGQAVNKVNGQYVNSQSPLPNLYLAGSYGFTISRPGGINARDLAADARVWHGGTNAVRVKVHYVIAEPDGIDCNMPGLTVHGWFPP